MTTHQLRIGSGLKYSSLFLSILMASTSPHASQLSTGAVSTVTKKVVDKAKEEKKPKKAPNTVQFTVSPTTTYSHCKPTRFVKARGVLVKTVMVEVMVA